MAKKTKHYCQCTLRKKTKNGYMEDISYIPQEYAIIGKLLKIRINGDWIDGWTVMDASDPRDADFVELHERDHIRQRRASDI